MSAAWPELLPFDMIDRQLPQDFARYNGFVEIVVKKHPGGLCSGQLTALELGDVAIAFLRRNPRFEPDKGRAPLILIGAGAGHRYRCRSG